MARVFGPQDIAAIAAAFKPAVPTKEEPSLVWNAAGDELLQSSKVQQKFESLLLSGEHRIPISSLPKTLNIKQAEWCIESRDAAVVYSSDRKAILTQPQVDKLLTSILEAAQKQYVELETFLASHEADRDSVKDKLDQDELEVIPEYHSKSVKTWLVSKHLHAKTTTSVQEILQNASSDHKTDISTNLPGVPRSIVLDLAQQAAQQHGIKGTVRSGKTRITFLSAAYENMLAEQKAKKVAHEFSKILVHTHRHGWHLVPEDTEEAPNLRDVFFERTKAGIADGSFSMIYSGDKPLALAFTNQLEDVLTELKDNASEMVVEIKAKDSTRTTSSLDSTRIGKLVDQSSNQDFARLVVQDPKYRSAIEQAMQTKLNEMESNDQQACNEAFNEYVRLPIRLYLTGLNDVKETSLRQRLEDYVLEFLSKDLVPTGIQHSEDEKQLRGKSLGKELEKFAQSCLEAKTLYELQNSLSKFAKKQKLEHVTMEDEFEVKLRILNQKLKAMKRMIRGSDILQNLVWILLAYEHPGLFISSGRDTTRMIRFYQSHGDEEIGKRLEEWKDRFKAGQESREDFEEMRALAEHVVEQIGAHEDELEPETNGESHSEVNGNTNGETVVKDFVQAE